VPISSAAIRGKMGDLYGYAGFGIPTGEFRDHYLRQASHAAAGEIIFDIETYPFEHISQAWKRQATGAHAKLVVSLP